jgi:hypothetical protein
VGVNIGERGREGRGVYVPVVGTVEGFGDVVVAFSVSTHCEG